MRRYLSFTIMMSLYLLTAPANAGTPTLAISPWNMGETIDFGSVAVGATSAPPQTTTLTAQYGNAQITSIVVNGSSAFDLTLGGANCGSGTVLNVTESCSFPAVFSPASTGTHAGTIRVTCQAFGAVTAATVLCNGIEQTIVSLLGQGFAVAQVPAIGQWGVTLLGLSIFGLALLQLRRRT